MSWRWPWVAREMFEETRRNLELTIHVQDKQVAELKRANHRLLDLVFKHQFGEQIYDTLPKEAEAAAEPEPELSEEQMAELEQTRAQLRSHARLAAIRHTRPSQLGRAVAREMEGAAHRTARAAHPAVHPATHPATQVFAAAREQASKQAG